MSTMFFIKRFQFFLFFNKKRVFNGFNFLCQRFIYIYVFVYIYVCRRRLVINIGGQITILGKAPILGVGSRVTLDFGVGRVAENTATTAISLFKLSYIYTCVYGVSAQTSCVEVVDPEIHDPPDFKPD